VAVCQAGIEKINITRVGTTNTLTASIVPEGPAVAASTEGGTVADLSECDPVCDPVILAMVVGDANWLIIDGVHQQSYPAGDPNAGGVEWRLDLHPKVGAEAEEVLENAMTQKVDATGRPIYNTATHHLEYGTFCLAKCEVGVKTALVVEYREMDPGENPVIPEFPVIGGTTQFYLLSAAATGEPLRDFTWGSGPTQPRAVPAASTWGLLVLMLLLLAGAKGYFGLWKRTQSVA